MTIIYHEFEASMVMGNCKPFAYAVVATTIRLRFDCNSTALRPFDHLRYGLAAALRPK